MTIVALVCDLIFESRITSTARRVGAEVRVVRTPEALAAAAEGADCVLLDLNAPAAQDDLIRELKSTRPERRVLGFVAHVDVERRRTALAAGADEVLSRSVFVERLARLLTPGAAS